MTRFGQEEYLKLDRKCPVCGRQIYAKCFKDVDSDRVLANPSLVHLCEHCVTLLLARAAIINGAVCGNPMSNQWDGHDNRLASHEQHARDYYDVNPKAEGATAYRRGLAREKRRQKCLSTESR